MSTNVQGDQAAKLAGEMMGPRHLPLGSSVIMLHHFRNFAEGGHDMTALGPLPSTLRCSKSGSFLGSCGRTGDAVGMPHADP
jgi:hypothetical protein